MWQVCNQRSPQNPQHPILFTQNPCISRPEPIQIVRSPHMGGPTEPTTFHSHLTADTSDPPFLRRLAHQTKLILNCAGPFRLCGPLSDSGADYVNICGEPEFMERMEASYHEKTVKNGSLVVSACGFESVTAELGLMFNSRVGEEGCREFGDFRICGFGVANVDKWSRPRRARPNPSKWGNHNSQPQSPGSGPPKVSTIEHQKKIGLWAVKLPSADAIVV